MKRSQIVFFILFPLVISLHAQGRSLLSFIETEGQVYVVQSEGNVLYFTDYHESFTYFISADVSNPRQPVILDSLMVEALIPDFDLKGDLAYLMLSDGLQGIGIVDISDPDSLGELRFFASVESSGSFIDEDTLFVADGRGLSVYDISRPDTLLLAWSFGSADAQEVFVEGSLVLLSVSDEGLYLLNRNTHDLAAMVTSQAISIGLMANPAYAFFSDNANGLIAVVITDAPNPVPVDTVSGKGEFAGGFITSGTLGYFCNGANGLRIFDISSPRAGLIEHTPFRTAGLFALRAVRASSILFVASANIDNTDAFSNGVFVVNDGSITSVLESPAEVPQSFALQQNYPNPFNPGTNITYQVPVTSEVRLDIFNLLGQRVRTLVDATREAGVHAVQWDGKDNTGNTVAAGVYLYELSVDSGHWSSTRKMIFLK